MGAKLPETLPIINKYVQFFRDQERREKQPYKAEDGFPKPPLSAGEFFKKKMFSHIVTRLVQFKLRFDFIWENLPNKQKQWFLGESAYYSNDYIEELKQYIEYCRGKKDLHAQNKEAKELLEKELVIHAEMKLAMSEFQREKAKWHTIIDMTNKEDPYVYPSDEQRKEQAEKDAGKPEKEKYRFGKDMSQAEIREEISVDTSF